MTKGKQSPNEIHTQIQYRLIERLEASERRYRLMVENLQEIVFTINESGTITFLNSAWNKILGYSFEESLQVPLIEFIHDQQLELGKETLNSILNCQKKIRKELNFKHKQGQSIWLELSANPVLDGGASGTLTDITERKQATARLKYAAFHDNLTGLYNRSGLMAYLNQEIVHSEKNKRYTFALLFLDLDGFKLINDTFGHLIGDRLLIEVAKRLKQCVKEEDIVARFGGDEFIILLSNLSNKNDAIFISEKIQHALKPAFNLKEQEAFIATSIGIVLNSQKTQQAEQFLSNGDVALYKAKERGKDNYVIFDDEMLAEIKERMQIETYLRQDINTNKEKFEIYYQPIINSSNFQIVGFEALLRWHHPKLGFISPAKFIPIAEETGLIVELGKQVLYKACQQLNQWYKLFPENKSCFISINLSVKQFKQTDLVKEIENILQITQFPPQNLKLEITESIMMNNLEENIAKIKYLKNLGIQFCIDDFGTGYSSLSYLHRFPIDILKIDRSFVNSISSENKNQEIIEAIIILAHKLGMNVIAEGVETKLQLATLQSYNCEQIQGYLFYPPLSAQSVEKVFTQSRMNHHSHFPKSIAI